MNLTDNHMLWLDLETTGSSAEADDIIEVGAILTTADLEVVDDFEELVRPSDAALGRMMRNAVVREMHEANGLLADVLRDDALEARPAGFVGFEMTEWLKGNGAKEGKVVLAGSGVGHFDRKFIDRQMPKLSKYLRYWCIDIGVIRRASEMWGGPRPEVNHNDAKTHRALQDAYCHLEEARAYRALWAA